MEGRLVETVMKSEVSERRFRGRPRFDWMDDGASRHQCERV